MKIDPPLRKPTVVHVIVGLGIGGAELMLKRLVKEQINHPCIFDHVIISLTTIGPIGQQLDSLGLKVHALNLRGLSNFLFVFLRLVLLIRQLNPSVVQTWMYHSDLIGGLAARLAGVNNVVWNIRNTFIPQRRWSKTQLIVSICARLSCWVPRRIVCCAVAARSIHITMGYEVSKMIVIPNGFDLTFFQTSPQLEKKTRKQLGFGRELTVIGIVGRFDPLKDYENFVRAATQVGTLRPQVRFVMMGRGVDISNTQLSDWLNKTGFSDRFVLLGERHDVMDVIAAIDIYCLSSRAEGFPNVVAEAMAMQVPCVVTDVGDAALILQDTGEVVPPQSSTTLADALVAMVDLSHEQRKVLGMRARKVIENRFSIEVVARQYMNLYLSLIL